MTFVNRNIDRASQMKISPGVMFSVGMEQYLTRMAELNLVHPDGLALVLLNIVAATLEFSFVLRANDCSKRIPTNLYNLIVARSCNKFCHKSSIFTFFSSIWEIGIDPIGERSSESRHIPSSKKVPISKSIIIRHNFICNIRWNVKGWSDVRIR